MKLEQGYDFAGLDDMRVRNRQREQREYDKPPWRRSSSIILTTSSSRLPSSHCPTTSPRPHSAFSASLNFQAALLAHSSSHPSSQFRAARLALMVQRPPRWRYRHTAVRADQHNKQLSAVPAPTCLTPRGFVFKTLTLPNSTPTWSVRMPG
eukprot:2447028-Rhodomonas_salina.2